MEDSIFSNYDLCSLIWSNLDLPTIGALSCLSKTTYRIYTDTYHIRLQKDFIIPANELFITYFSVTKPLLITTYDRVTNETITQIMLNIITLLDPFVNNQLWIALVNDLELMEDMFYSIAYIEQSLKYSKHTNLYDVFHTDLYNKVKVYFDKINQYLYVEYPSQLNVNELKVLAAFKHIKKYYKKNRSQLIYSLKRPPNELYFLQ